MAELFLEIIELEDGEVALREVESDAEPVMKVSFSADMQERLQDKYLEVAKVMLSAGIHMAAEVHNKNAEADEAAKAQVQAEEAPRVLH